MGDTGGDEQRVQLRVLGHVQGVSFRQTACNEAQRLRLRGYVRNLRSGEVEAIAEGAMPQVAEFIRWCHSGPPHARVTQVLVSEVPRNSQLGPFRVEYDLA